MELKIDAHLWCLGTYAERYVPGGYFDPLSLDEQLQRMSKIEGLSGLFVFYPTAPLPADPERLVKKLADYNLRVSNICAECWSDPRWKFGAFTTGEKPIRREAIQRMKETIDFGKAIGADSVLLWPAHDGFDYPFQTDYRRGWEYLVESVREIGQYDPQVKIAVEYKSKDPRQRQYVGNVGKLMALAADVGLENVGGALDVGHALMAGENLAESMVLLDSHKKLYQIHMNENYRDADPDMIFGTIHFWEILELFYWLNKTDFRGWCSIDIIAARDDRVRSLEVGVKLIRKYYELARRLTAHADAIDANLKHCRFADNIEALSEIIFG
jgi:xylose isomerase